LPSVVVIVTTIDGAALEYAATVSPATGVVLPTPRSLAVPEMLIVAATVGASTVFELSLLHAPDAAQNRARKLIFFIGLRLLRNSTCV
jgi:hypothetical protein